MHIRTTEKSPVDTVRTHFLFIQDSVRTNPTDFNQVYELELKVVDIHLSNPIHLKTKVVCHDSPQVGDKRKERAD